MLSISGELASKMELFPEVVWSQVAKKAIEEYLDQRIAEKKAMFENKMLKTEIENLRRRR